MDSVSVSQPAGAFFVDDSNELFARRLSRTAFGGVLALAPALVLVQWTVAEQVAPRSFIGHSLPLIALTWVAAAAAGAVALRFGRSRYARSFFSDDAFAGASFVVPALGVALAGPLSLHALIASPFYVAGVALAERDLRVAFDGWLGFSLMGTMHVHIAFAVAMVAATKRLVAGDAAAKVLLWPAVVLAFVPGILILFPPVLVWITGFIVSRLFFRRVRRWLAEDERIEAERC